MKMLGATHWFLILAITSFAVQAGNLNQDEALKLRQQGAILPLERLVERALALYPGSKLLEAELEEKSDSYVYEVELVTAQGVVRELKFDATDSRLLTDKEDD